MFLKVTLPHRGNILVEKELSFENKPQRGGIKPMKIMANTYSQISIHAVFAVKGRENIITMDWRNNLRKYLSGIIAGNGAKSLAVGGCKDHVHIFFGMPVTTR